MRPETMHDDKTHRSRLVEEAAAGEAFVIGMAGRPMVRRLGLLGGQCTVPDDFDQMAAGDIAALFEGAGQGG
ncbi:type II toxin-antitoxin system prevent-host-death family antitoxin [Synechococcus sp. CCY9202]|uniref:type II toxin-antitoxin system Phd/YefM family antitoxin n=1 Tax=Synechococcus sp. CCY9202 TaxID=174698 RepID=UPI002B2092A1|nr:type II toxin-antitoxin system prevent-host-death family antitoxin [Synechococcus sp. CCY9202]MEA5424352.1 type II toxin-antitoxin system prevent-host-death family antitoxin [Synechococcus sp. CCY9202]